MMSSTDFTLTHIQKGGNVKATCGECASFFAFPEGDLDYEMGKGDGSIDHCWGHGSDHLAIKCFFANTL